MIRNVLRRSHTEEPSQRLVGGCLQQIMCPIAVISMTIIVSNSLSLQYNQTIFRLALCAFSFGQVSNYLMACFMFAASIKLIRPEMESAIKNEAAALIKLLMLPRMGCTNNICHLILFSSSPSPLDHSVLLSF